MIDNPIDTDLSNDLSNDLGNAPSNVATGCAPRTYDLEEALMLADELSAAGTLAPSATHRLTETMVSPTTISAIATDDIEGEAKDIVDASAYSFSKTERNILDLALKGRAPGVIAAQLNLPQSFVRGFLLRKEAKEYLRDLKEAKSQLIQLKALDIFSDIIDARVDQLEESGGSYAELSRKDTVDILRAAVELASGIDKSREKADEGDVYVNILQQVMR